MDDSRDLELILRSRTPLVVVETHEEARVLELLMGLSQRMMTQLYRWSVTEGLRRLDKDMAAQRHNIEPAAVLGHIRSAKTPGLYVLLDFHPYLSEPINVRMLKDIALECEQWGATIILLSHEIELPGELARYSARFELSLPSPETLRRIINDVAREWGAQHVGKRVRADAAAVDLLVRNLAGLPLLDARRLIRNAIYLDGAITQEDIPAVMQAKYRLLEGGGALSFEYDTARFSDLGGMKHLKSWLQRRAASFSAAPPPGLEPPKGILLLGVQGCGKSLAAKSVAGTFGVPLLRLDFGTLYNKYHGETERNLREALRTAEVMSPCVLWMDEIEKGIGTDSGEGSGPSKRVLGALLTWMAERTDQVFMVATANDITALPPELVRKGRFDEIFFVDLPDAAARLTILDVHLKRRNLDPEAFDLTLLVSASEGFSGAELEQAVVSALYESYATGQPVSGDMLLHELQRTRPLSVVMAEKIEALRRWAAERTVPAD
ncbi:AAA family ATPase [Nitrincola sp. MINF-07-Sa-05]|uniref:AAA family ATPase n=1 Tax=Nitrincola salilacus TaxID=3400273 RepID=UPI0039182A10